ncbi:hypothetical protein [Dyadobacter sp. 32]|uniref:hypothetical protein n=1 Tax=Dyadobacter sp. 32 TaxID=538966 RepID=UPI0011EFD9CD
MNEDVNDCHVAIQQKWPTAPIIKNITKSGLGPSKCYIINSDLGFVISVYEQESESILIAVLQLTTHQLGMLMNDASLQIPPLRVVGEYIFEIDPADGNRKRVTIDPVHNLDRVLTQMSPEQLVQAIEVDVAQYKGHK